MSTVSHTSGDVRPELAIASNPVLPASPARRPRRNNNDIDRQRADLEAKTHAEIGRLHAEDATRLPRSQAEAVGAAYCRYSTRFQDSIGDQVRTIFNDAEKRRIFVPRELIFFDLAVRGVKSHRVGLDLLREALVQKQAGVVMFFATNR